LNFSSDITAPKLFSLSAAHYVVNSFDQLTGCTQQTYTTLP
jgi:hypothetical protein